MATSCMDIGNGYVGLVDELRISKGVLTPDQMISKPKSGLSIIIR